MGGGIRLNPVIGIAGVLIAAAGARLLVRALGRLRRAGAFSSTFWASLGEYRGYRLRSLRPLLTAALGAGLLGLGLWLLYAGVTAYYAGHLAHPLPGCPERC